MKVSTFKFYRDSIILFVLLGLVIIALPLSEVVANADETNDNYTVLFIAMLAGIAMAIFPVLLNYKQITIIHLTDKKCVSYSLLRKKLCEIDYHKEVFYSFFDVKFLYAHPVRFAAISNKRFECDQNPTSVFEKRFYGTYDKSSIIVIPVDDSVVRLMNFADWEKID